MSIAECLKNKKLRFSTYLSTDKDKYKPGELVFIRATFLNTFTHKPAMSILNHAVFRLTIKSPDGTVCYGGHSIDLPAPKNSVLSFYWRIPKDQVGGDYEISLDQEYGGSIKIEEDYGTLKDGDETIKDVKSSNAPKISLHSNFSKRYTDISGGTVTRKGTNGWNSFCKIPIRKKVEKFSFKIHKTFQKDKSGIFIGVCGSNHNRHSYWQSASTATGGGGMRNSNYVLNRGYPEQGSTYEITVDQTRNCVSIKKDGKYYGENTKRLTSFSKPLYMGIWMFYKGNKLTVSGGTGGGDWEPLISNGRRKFTISNYRPPKFKMDLTFLRKGFGVGDKAKAVLKVERSEGGFPEKGTCEATARVDGKEIFRKNYKIDPKDGTCMIAFDLPKEIKEGNGSLSCAVTEGVTENTSKTIPIILKKIDCKLYPEGGDLVYGCNNGCYFETKTLYGDPCDFHGLLIEKQNGQEKILKLVKTEHEGRGSFEFKPEKGRDYFIKVLIPSGVTVPITMPKIKEHGLTVRLKNKKSQEFGKSFSIVLESTDTIQAKIALFKKEKCVSLSKAFPIKKGVPTEAKVDPKDCDGCLRMTVFFIQEAFGISSLDFPCAERLVFIKPKMELDFEVTTDKPVYTPGSSVEVTIKSRLKGSNVPVKSYCAITITDDSVVKMKEKRERSPKLLEMVYLEDEVKELKDPLAYFNPEKEEGIPMPDPGLCTDLLFGTQYWRRFIYKAYKADQKFFENDKNFKDIDKDLIFRILNVPNVFKKAPKAHEIVSNVLEKDFEEENDDSDDDGMMMDMLSQIKSSKSSFTRSVSGTVKKKGGKKKKKKMMMRQKESMKMEEEKSFRRLPSRSSAPRAPRRMGRGRGGGGRGGGRAPQIRAPPAKALKMQFFAKKRSSNIAPAPNRLLKAPSEKKKMKKPKAMPKRSMPPPRRGGFGARMPRRPPGRFSRLPSPPKPVIYEPPVTVIQYRREYAHKKKEGRKPGERNDFTETIYYSSALELKQVERVGFEKKVKFDLSDNITTFRIFVDGFTETGIIGSFRKAVIVSKKAFYVEAKVPLEVSFKDKVKIPISIVNNLTVGSNCEVNLGRPKILVIPKPKWEGKLKEKERRVEYFDMSIASSYTTKGKNNIWVRGKLTDWGLSDELKREVKVKSYGFPTFFNFSGKLNKKGKLEYAFTIPDSYVENSLETVAYVIPTNLSQFTSSLKGLVREPYGCFEQVSATMYPMIMAVQFMNDNSDNLDMNLLNRIEKHLDSGYKKLKGYEIRSGGFDWYGRPPANESLSAMGLVQFLELRNVKPIDENIIQRTKKWLLSRVNKSGDGFLRGSGRYGYGYAPVDTTNAYIVWALSCSDVGYDEIKTVCDALLKKTRGRNDDCYIIALVSLAMFNYGKEKEAKELATKLVAHQKGDGSIVKASSTITRSSGLNRNLETTALSALAFLNFKSFSDRASKAIDFILKNNRCGRYGSTQATVLCIKAIVKAFSGDTGEGEGKVEIMLNGAVASTIQVAKTANKTIEFDDFRRNIVVGKENKMTIVNSMSKAIPFSVQIACKVAKPPSNQEKLPFIFSTKLNNTKMKEGDSTEIVVELTNMGDEERPMMTTIVSLPGGLEPRIKKLQELQKKEDAPFDYFELFGARDVVFYFRGMQKGETKKFSFDVIAQIPGYYVGDACRGYEYYNDTEKFYVAGLECDIATK